MSYKPTSILRSRTPQAVLRTPVEVWHKIIDHVLYDPIAFIIDPYYPGCNLHTAFSKWSDRKHLRKVEAQRGTLRLVSRSWKESIDLRHKKYFEAYRYDNTTQQLAWSHSADRLEFSPQYVAAKIASRGTKSKCDVCLDYKTAGLEPTASLLLGPHPFNATILSIPVAEQSRLSPDVPAALIFPKVRALSLEYDEFVSIPLLDLFTRLTFLDLHLFKGSPTRESSAPLQLSVLKTLHLTLVEGEDWMLETFQRWDMPVLAHAELRIEFGVPEPSSLNAFFTHIGKKLIRFCLCLFGDWVTLPDNFWKVMPMLEYLGTSALEYDTYRLSPPRDHPFQRLALWDDGVQMDEARGRAGVLAEMWKTLYTISDAHDWADMARQIEDHVFNLDDPKFEEDSVYHQEVYANDCCKCVCMLYATCKRWGVRYEDRNGRTWAEYCRAESL